MQSFLQHHAAGIKGVLSGFDRIRFRGTLQWLASVRGMSTFMGTMGILLKDFRNWFEERTDRIRLAGHRVAEAAGRPFEHLQSSRICKEDFAREIAEADKITEGLVCVLSCVEPCHSFRVHPNRDKKQLELSYQPMKCLHHYFYLIDRQLGWLHVRLQTWAPFNLFICINGREWAARQFMAKGIEFEQRDNCFVDVAKIDRAQAVLDRQLGTDWPLVLNRLTQKVHPSHATLFGLQTLHYYWSAEETEWATDVMFHSRESLARLYPRLVRHATSTFGSGEVLRFLGKSPQVRRHRKAEIVSTLSTRPEGTCVKHRLNSNSVKMYDKQETVLRVETTVNNPRDMKVLRPCQNGTEKKKWQRLRKGVADLHRRAEISQKSNERYLEALATVDSAASLKETLQPLCQPTKLKGRRVRGLQPFESQDSALLAAVARGEFMINGFRNRDLRALLFGAAQTTSAEAKRQMAKVTRLIRLLRAHGLVHKIPKTHRYQLAPKGQTITAALQTAQQATLQALAQLAA